jgi:monovalent cation/hydrogen antiporter
VTVAAAQTLPTTTPDRALLVLVAFAVAAGSLLLQGGTLALVVRWVRPARAEVATDAERGELVDRLMAANREVLDRHADDPEIAAFRDRLADRDGRPDPVVVGRRVQVRLEMIEAQRAALLAAQDEGAFTSESLTSTLENLDAEQISIELRSRPDLAG